MSHELSHAQRARLMSTIDLQATVEMFTARARSDKGFAELVEAYKAELAARGAKPVSANSILANLAGLDEYASALLEDDDDE